MAEKVLITGGAGFIGRHTANTLASQGYHVRILDNLSKQVHPVPRESLLRLDPAIEFICGDIRDRSKMQDALQGIDVVFHFAAETGVGQSMYEVQRYSDVNIQGTAVLCDCIAKNTNRPKRIILSSSRAVYGEGQYNCTNCGTVYPDPRTSKQLKTGQWDLPCPKCSGTITSVPCQEIAPSRPLSIYSLTKQVQEDLFKMVSSTYNVQAVILRYFNVFGAGQSVSNPYTGVLSIFASRMLSNESIEIYEDGMMQRDFVPIQDVVKSNIEILKMIVSPDILVLNVGTGISKTILQVAESLKKEIGSKSAVEITGRYRIGDIRHCFADMAKTASYIGKPSESSFKQGIRDLIDWASNEGKTAELEKSLTELSDLGLTGTAVS